MLSNAREGKISIQEDSRAGRGEKEKKKNTITL